jgi:hypothetical protein
MDPNFLSVFWKKYKASTKTFSSKSGQSFFEKNSSA